MPLIVNKTKNKNNDIKHKTSKRLSTKIKLIKKKKMEIKINTISAIRK
jgi:hypothetical protein